MPRKDHQERKEFMDMIIMHGTSLMLYVLFNLLGLYRVQWLCIIMTIYISLFCDMSLSVYGLD